MTAGVIFTEENEAISCAYSLETLSEAKGIDKYKAHLVENLNQSLYALSFMESEVRIHPPTLRLRLSISSPKKKDLFVRIRDQREKHAWHSDDPEKEQRIQAVIKRYIQFGNPYGI